MIDCLVVNSDDAEETEVEPEPNDDTSQRFEALRADLKAEQGDDEEDSDELENLKNELEEVMNKLDEAIREIDSLEFPGIYG